MEDKKRRRSNENSPKSKKKLNKLKRHAPKQEFKSKKTVTSSDDESDGSQSEPEVDVHERGSEEPLPLPRSPAHSTPSTPGSESRSRSPSGESVPSVRLDSDGEEVENGSVRGPPTPGGNSDAVVPVDPLVDPLEPLGVLNFNVDVAAPINAPPPVEGLEHLQMEIADKRQLHMKEGTNAPNFLQIIIFTR